jgi:hypothetical protein
MNKGKNTAIEGQDLEENVFRANMDMSGDRNAGRDDSVKIGNSSIERVEEFKYLGTMLTDQNFVQEELGAVEIRECLLSFGAESVFFQVAFQTLKDQDIILPVVLYGCETWSLTLREGRRLRVFENRVLRRVFGPKRDEVTGE